MTFVSIRDALVSVVNAGWTATYPTIPVFYENATSVDLDDVGAAFLRCTVRFVSGDQASLGEAPLTRIRGAVDLRAFIKVEAGTRTALGYMDYLKDLLKYKDFSGVRTGAPNPPTPQAIKNWYSLGISVPFWADM